MDLGLSTVWQTLGNMGRSTLALLPRAAVGLVVFGLFLVGAKLFRLAIARISSKRRGRRNVGLVLGRLGQGTTVLVGLLVSLVIVFPSFKAGDLIGVLGLSSVAIGFAFRDVLQNFLSGILLLWTEPFRLGDQIRAGEFEGTVEDIQTRATFIRTYDGRRVVVPNAVLFTEAVTVNTALEKRRSEYDVGVGFGDDATRAAEIIVAAVKQVPGVLADPPPEALVVDLGDFSVKVRAFWWTDPHRLEILRVQDRCLRAIQAALAEAGIDLPFPTRQILFHDQTEAADGDRARQREGWPSRGADNPRPARLGLALGSLGGSSGERSDEGAADERDGPPSRTAKRDAPRSSRSR